MICIKYFPQETRLQARGHAGYAPEGQDIVCAGISALFGALAMHPLTEQRKEADWQVIVAKEGAAEVMRPYFEMIAQGMTDIAKQYPDHVLMGIVNARQRDSVILSNG